MKRIFRDERGYTTVLYSFVILIFIALSGLLIDGGRLMIAKIQLEEATEIAGLSAVVRSVDQDRYDREGVMAINQSEFAIQLPHYLNVNMEGVNITGVFFHPTKLHEVTIVTEVKVDTAFMKLFGKESGTVTSKYRIFLDEGDFN